MGALAAATPFDEERKSPNRAAEIAAFAASDAAPPEVRLQARLARLYSGSAAPAEVLAVWRDRELPFSMRQMALYATRGGAPMPELAAELARELREEKLPPAEERVVLAALQEADRPASAALAAQRWEDGAVPLGEGHEREAEAWASALDAEAVRSRPRVRDAVKKALDDPGAGPTASGLLAKTGDLETLPRLIFAIRTGCFG
jgi:hypothetical protein